MFIKIYENIKNYIKDNYKFLITIIIIVAIFWVRLPFLIYTPGGAVDLDKRISIKDAYVKNGKFQMAYVSMVRGSIPFILASYILPNWDLIKASDVTLENESVDNMIKRDQVFLKQSIDDAVINAYKLANKKIEIIKIFNHIVFIHEEAKTTLKLYDELISANGIEITSLEQYLNLVESLKVGDVINLKVLRNKKIVRATAEVILIDGKLKSGISIVSTFDYKTTPKIKITSKASESGSSGGLMLSLSIYNKLVKEDISKGKNVIGTGTIDLEGKVGEIGGVKYKLIGAIKDKANVFICPDENLAEARKVADKNNYDIKIIGVSTLEEAIAKLKEI